MGCNCGQSKLAPAPHSTQVSERVATVPNHPDNFAKPAIFQSPNGPTPKQG